MTPKPRALLLDLDGTVVSDDGKIRPRVADAIRGLIERDVPVMVVTGRSEPGVGEIAAELGLKLPVSVYNGAALWDPATGDLIEERILSNRLVANALELAEREDLLTVAMQRGTKFASEPANDLERAGLAGLEALNIGPRAELPREYLIRIGFYSDRHGDSGEFVARVEEQLSVPCYLTDFPLSVLAQHRSSPLQAVDVQPPCRGKAEALRWLAEELDIPAGEVVAAGDGSNDVPMLERAGLGVALEGAMERAIQAADRVIGSCNTDALADLIEEQFG